MNETPPNKTEENRRKEYKVFLADKTSSVLMQV
jgi:hypothetical protein